MNVVRAEGVDLAQVALQHHFSGLPHHRVAGVVVRDGEHHARLVDRVGQLLGLGQVEGHRLVANDVEAGFDRRLGDFKMGVVRRGDREKVDPLVGRQLGFAFDQFLVGAVRPFGRNVVVSGRRFCLFRVARQRPCHQGGAIVENRGGCMHAADKGALPAADEGLAKFTVEGSVGCHGVKTP